MHQQKLPADPTSLILSIIAAVLVLVGCCCGFGGIISLTLAIIGLVMANKSNKLYREAPENYTPQSKGNVQASKVISIIAIVIAGIQVAFWIFYFAAYGTLVGTQLYDAQQRGVFDDNYDFDTYEEANDSINSWDYEDEITPIESDTLRIDSIPAVETEVD